MIWNSIIKSLIAVLQLLLFEKQVTKRKKLRIKLGYFNVGRLVQSIRFTLCSTGIPFVEEQLTEGESLEEGPFGRGQMIVLTVTEKNGVIETEDIIKSESVLRYVSKLARTYPSNPIHALTVDSWVEFHNEFLQPIKLHMDPSKFCITLSDKEKMVHKETILSTHLPYYLKYIDEKFANSDWFGDFDGPSMIDYLWYPTLVWLNNEEFYSPNNTLFEKYPNLKQYISQCDNLLCNTDGDESNEESGEESGEES